MLKLRVLKDGVEIQSIDLAVAGKAAVMLGRAANSDIRLEDRAVGREHALFMIASGGVAVQKRSKFGRLAVNGAETDQAALKAGDVIDIASYQLRLENSVSEPAPVVATIATGSLGGAPPELAMVSEGQTSEIEVSAPLQSQTASESPIAMESMNTGTPAMVQSSDSAAEETPPEAPLMDSNLGESERTAMISQNAVVTKLVFNPGDANAEEYVFKKPETTLGRGTNCDIVLTTKKASRKHLVIRRVGMNFVAQDQGSANGTYVNGVRITEQELAGDDVLRIGETEFRFTANSQDYFEQQGGFIPVVQDQQLVEPEPDPMPEPVQDPMAMQVPLSGVPIGGGIGEQITGAPIPGLASQAVKKKESPMEWFKRQPLIRKIIVVVAAAMLIAFLMNDEEDTNTKKVDTKPKVVDKADAAFNALPAEKKQFIINTYQLAFELYKNQEFERAMYEVDKILHILPGGYKEAKEIKNYAQKSIETVKAAEEEKRRKEGEERLRKEVAELVTQAQLLVDQGKDTEAKELFNQILEKDPDNPTVLRLRQEIDEREQRKKAEEEEARERTAKRAQLVSLIEEGRRLLKAGKYYDVMARMEDAPIVYTGDAKLLEEAKGLIIEAKRTLKSKLMPHLDAAKAAFESGNLPAARDAYYAALKVDYKSSEARAGLAKIRDILHDRSKKIYTDAIISEGLSDFKTAKIRYKECLDQAMRDDIYYGRCERRWKRFQLIGLDDGPAVPSTTDPVQLSPVSNGQAKSADPEAPQLPEVKTGPSPASDDKAPKGEKE